MSEERMQILKMLEEGKISAKEAAELLGAVEKPAGKASAEAVRGRWLRVLVTDLSTGDITSWDWSFGNGGSSTLQNPTHTYTDSDQYTVALTVSGPEGTHSTTKASYITVCEGVAIGVYPVCPTEWVSSTFTIEIRITVKRIIHFHIRIVFILIH